MSQIESLADRCGLEELLSIFPGLAVRPSKDHDLRLVGKIAFEADGGRGLPRIAESFEVEIRVARDFPLSTPRAFERGGRMPAEYHRNGGGDLCLGAPLTLYLILRREPTLRGFVERILVPYLYRWAHIERFGKEPWPELPHSDPGIDQELCNRFATGSPRVMRELLGLARMKQRAANKLPCPCESGRRLGHCHNRQVNYFRRIEREHRLEVQALRVRLAREQRVGASN